MAAPIQRATRVLRRPREGVAASARWTSATRRLLTGNRCHYDAGRLDQAVHGMVGPDGSGPLRLLTPAGADQQAGRSGAAAHLYVAILVAYHEAPEGRGTQPLGGKVEHQRSRLAAFAALVRAVRADEHSAADHAPI